MALIFVAFVMDLLLKSALSLGVLQMNIIGCNTMLTQRKSCKLILQVANIAQYIVENATK